MYCLLPSFGKTCSFCMSVHVGISARIQGSHMGCSGLQGLCRSWLRLWRILRLTEPTIHNSTPVVGAGVPGPGLGLGSAGRRGEWLVSIIDRIMKQRWLMKAEKKRERWIQSHPHTWRKDATYTQSESDKPWNREKRENTIKNMDKKHLSVGFFTIRFPLGHKAWSLSEVSQMWQYFGWHWSPVTVEITLNRVCVWAVSKQCLLHGFPQDVKTIIFWFNLVCSSVGRTWCNTMRVSGSSPLFF